MASKEYCCYCDEETGFEKGYSIYEAFDGKYGHEWCVEKYNLKNKPLKLSLEEKIEALQGAIWHLDREKEEYLKEIEGIRKEIKDLDDKPIAQLQ